MLDFFGMESGPMAASIPAGGWCLVRLKDTDNLGELIKAGAHVNATGALVCIFQRGGQSGVFGATTTKADGTVIKEEPTIEPPHFVCVHGEGYDLTVPRRNANGHGEFVPVKIHAYSALIDSVQPLEQLEDMPPGRKVGLAWAASRFGKPVPQKVVDAAMAQGRDWAEVREILAAM